jgi:hypothetical protein
MIIIFIFNKTVTIKSTFEITRKVCEIVLKFKNSPVRKDEEEDMEKHLQKYLMLKTNRIHCTTCGKRRNSGDEIR